MNLKEFKQIMQETAKGTEFEGKTISVWRFNDKRKHHRRIAFKTIGNIKLSPLFEAITEKLVAKGLNAKFDNTQVNYYGDGSMVNIYIEYPLDASWK